MTDGEKRKRLREIGGGEREREKTEESKKSKKRKKRRKKKRKKGKRKLGRKSTEKKKTTRPSRQEEQREVTCVTRTWKRRSEGAREMGENGYRGGV